MWYCYVAILAMVTGATLGALATDSWLSSREVKVVTDAPVRCVVELNQAAGLNQQTIRYEGEVK